jgi:MFS family permease
MAAVAISLRSPVSSNLPPDARSQVRIILAGRFLNDLGRGLTVPFNAAYFHRHVGFSMTLVGIGLGLFAGMGVLAVFFGGYLSDRFGRKKCLVTSMLACSGLYALYPWIQTPAGYLVISAFTGAFLSLYWPASSAMITDLTDPAKRGRVFSILRVVVNSAIGLGTLLASIWLGLAGGSAFSYHLLFYMDAATYLGFLLIICFLIRETLPAHAAEAYGGFVRGWREAFRDVRLVSLALILPAFTIMYSIYGIFAVFFEKYVELKAFQTGIALVLNTAIVAAFQIPFWSMVDSWRRTRILILGAFFFMLGCLGFILSFSGPTAGLAMVLASVTLFTFGELCHAPASDSLIATMAPVHLRGTYMSVQSLTWCIGLTVGPILQGRFLDAGRPGTMWGLFLALLAVASVGLLALERRLLPGVNQPARMVPKAGAD